MEGKRLEQEDQTGRGRKEEGAGEGIMEMQLKLGSELRVSNTVKAS